MVMWVSRLLYNYICMVKCMCHHAYEPTYRAIYVCSLVCKCMRVVTSKRRLICMHIYVVAYVWQGFMIWVHNYMVTPSMLISQVYSWLCMKVRVIIILCKWLQMFRAWMIIVKKTDDLWALYGGPICVRQVPFS